MWTPTAMAVASDAAVCPLGKVFHCTLARPRTARFTRLTTERDAVPAGSIARGARLGIHGSNSVTKEGREKNRRPESAHLGLEAARQQPEVAGEGHRVTQQIRQLEIFQDGPRRAANERRDPELARTADGRSSAATPRRAGLERSPATRAASSPPADTPAA